LRNKKERKRLKEGCEDKYGRRRREWMGMKMEGREMEEEE